MDNRITLREALTAGIVASDKLDPADAIQILRDGIERLTQITGEHGIDNLIDPNDAMQIADDVLSRILF